MTDLEISDLIVKEFAEKKWGVTEQYLKIHKPIYQKKCLKIDRIDREKEGGIVVTYLPVKGQYFYFAISIDDKNKEIVGFGTESRNLVSIIAASEEINSTELKSFTKLACSESWNKGDRIPNNKSKVYSFSGIEFCPNPEPDEFEDKLEKLITFLETDKKNIITLSNMAYLYVHVCMDFHKGNQLLGGMALGSKTIKRMGNLNLSIDFQITAWGKGFR
jgi:hypothetical protein